MFAPGRSNAYFMLEVVTGGQPPVTDTIVSFPAGKIALMPHRLTVVKTYNWPDGLPQRPQKSGYQEHFANNRLEFKPDVGPAKIRPKYTIFGKRLTVTYKLPIAQANQFEVWFKTLTLSGTEEFVFPNPRTEEDMWVRILSAPTYTPIGGGLWEVQMTLEERVGNG